ncbi:MAG: ThiF family adenylyltransferase, partial [Candidatus Nanohaloarchaea archaeon]
MEARFLINDFCVKHGIPWVHTGVRGGRGEVMPVVPGETPCFECVFHGTRGEPGTCDSESIEPEAAEKVAETAVEEAWRILEGEGRGGLVRIRNGRRRRLEVGERSGCSAC